MPPEQCEAVSAKDFVEQELLPLIMDESKRSDTITDSVKAVRETGELIFCTDFLILSGAAWHHKLTIGSLVSFICKELKMRVEKVQTGLSLMSKSVGIIENPRQNKFIIHFKPI